MADLKVVLEEIRSFREDNNTRLGEIKEEISKMSARLDEAEGRIERAEERIQNTEDAMTEIINLQIRLEDKLMDLESRSRRENIRIYGVPETAERDSPTMSDFVEKLLRDGLEVPGTSLTSTLNGRIARSAWHGRKEGLRGMASESILDHDYPPLILKKRREYADARRILKNSKSLSDPLPGSSEGEIHGRTKIYNTVVEATADMASRGYAVKS
ncbi:hypothetical protein WMY93_034368 [Mugilogobius chulae]|uniref:Uncharacterized protein n=1 Tax=Mugilogobius chulae TaxID=88201 RepID=A0AAW0MGN9_9GOBI